VDHLPEEHSSKGNHIQVQGPHYTNVPWLEYCSVLPPYYRNHATVCEVQFILPPMEAAKVLRWYTFGQAQDRFWRPSTL